MKKLTEILAVLIFVSVYARAFAEVNVKSGISYSQQWGLYIANIVETDGKITNVIIDRLANGKSSKELHDNYGIKPVSSLNKDWWEQVAYYEDWVLEHGIDAVKYDKDGHAENVDLISGATIGIDDLTLAVLDALKVKTAPDVITLSYSDHEPLGNMRTKFLNDVLFPAIEKESNGRIKITPHWNGELSTSYKALPTVQEAEIAQLAVVVPEYFMDALPFHQVFKSFPIGPTRQEQVNFFRSIYEKIPALKDEIEKQNLHVIFIATGFPAAFFSHEPLTDLCSIKGQKWRSASFWHKDFLSNAGAIPVTMPWGSKVFEALADGSLDGLIVNIDSGYDIKAHTEAKYVAVSPKLWLGHAYLIAMNKDVWNSLSEKEQKAFERAANLAYNQLGDVMNAALPEQIERLQAEGAEVRILSDEEVSKWERITKYKDIQDKWAEDKIGVLAILETVRNYMQETR